ncbi:MAG: PAS domain-containing protein, partial [Cyanobacteria bacterium J06626_26]
MSLFVTPSIDAPESITSMASFLNAVAYPVYAKGRDHRWIFANTACCQLLDTPLEQLVGCVDSDLAAVMDAELLRSQDDNFFKTGTIASHTITLNTRYGQRQMRGGRSLLQTDDGPILINTLQDISELTQIRHTNRA